MLMALLFVPQVTEYLNSQESAKSARVSDFIHTQQLCLIVLSLFFTSFSVASSSLQSWFVCLSVRNLILPKQEYITTLITFLHQLPGRKCLFTLLHLSLSLSFKMRHIILAVTIVPYGLLPTVCAGPYCENGGGDVWKSVPWGQKERTGKKWRMNKRRHITPSSRID